MPVVGAWSLGGGGLGLIWVCLYPYHFRTTRPGSGYDQSDWEVSLSTLLPLSQLRTSDGSLGHNTQQALVTLRQGKRRARKKKKIKKKGFVQHSSIPFSRSVQVVIPFSQQAVALSACQMAVKAFGHEYS